jgi:uncharacterized protein with HEPN domain
VTCAYFADVIADVIESCDSIIAAVRGLDLGEYEGNRLLRSSVEREFNIIGEARRRSAGWRRRSSIQSRGRGGSWVFATS